MYRARQGYKQTDRGYLGPIKNYFCRPPGWEAPDHGDQGEIPSKYENIRNLK